MNKKDEIQKYKEMLILLYKLFRQYFIEMQNQKRGEKDGVEFSEVQKSFGLTHELFLTKFVYPQHQITTSRPNAYLVPTFHPLPSQFHSISQRNIKRIHAALAQLLFQVGTVLKVPITTTTLAQTIFHFYFVRKSHVEVDGRDVAMGAMFLACKAEETLRKTYQIILAFDHVLKVSSEVMQVAEGQQKPPTLDYSSSQYQYMKQKVVSMEHDILFELGFELWRLSDLPYRYMAGMLGLFDAHPKREVIAQSAWVILADLYRTIVCLYYPPQVVSTAAVFIGVRRCGVSFPDVPWWVLGEAYLSIIREIQAQLEFIYGQQVPSFEEISSILEDAAKLQNIKNVFVVPYYRKIMLDQLSKLRINLHHSEQQPQIQIQHNVVVLEHPQHKEVENKHHQESSPSKHKKISKKDKKKKHKKNKKHKRKNQHSSDESNTHSYPTKEKVISQPEEIEKKEVEIIPTISKVCEEKPKFKGWDLKTAGTLASSITEKLKKHEERAKKKDEQKEMQEQKDPVKEIKNNQNLKDVQEQKEKNEDDDDLMILAELRKKVLKKKQEKKQQQEK